MNNYLWPAFNNRHHGYKPQILKQYMPTNKYIYSFTYDLTEGDLCKLESKYIFNEEEKDKLLLSTIKVEPSSSAFIKSRLDVMEASEDYAELIVKIKNENIHIEGFKVEYVVLHGDTTEYPVRLTKLKDIGFSIEGTPDYYKPTVTYGLCYLAGVWYFGILNKDEFDWLKHKEKPCSYSNSININIAKALINIAAERDKERTLLDACCGVGTIMLEACFAGVDIEGCDINAKICRHVRKNLAHFNYSAEVYNSDIKDISKNYDAAIIDLPYNHFSYAHDDSVAHIIESTAHISKRLVIVSIVDIEEQISHAGLTLLDSCSIKKSGKAKFTRKIWVCEKHV